ncbi:MAG: DinB family protein [Acidimicrobiales bacterium]
MTDACEECGFDLESVGPAEAVAALRAFGRRYRAPLTRFLPGEDGSAVVRARPAPDVWSALEYAAHVRDVFDWYAARVERTLAEDRPVFDVVNHEEAAVQHRYNEQDPATVADELAANADRLATVFEGVPDEAWDRFGITRGQERSILSHARRGVHEGNHHLLDIGRGLRTVREQAKK